MSAKLREVKANIERNDTYEAKVLKDFSEEKGAEMKLLYMLKEKENEIERLKKELAEG